VVRVLRAMKRSEDGLPKPGSSARTLGVRANIDIPVDEDDYVRPEMGGMSVSPPPPDNLPYFRRPPEFGGTAKDLIWVLETDNLPSGLSYRPDPANPEGHGFVEPSSPMSFEDYQGALRGTRALWTPM
jgi:hypothetical protein